MARGFFSRKIFRTLTVSIIKFLRDSGLNEAILRRGNALQWETAQRGVACESIRELKLIGNSQSKKAFGLESTLCVEKVARLEAENKRSAFEISA